MAAAFRAILFDNFDFSRLFLLFLFFCDFCHLSSARSSFSLPVLLDLKTVKKTKIVLKVPSWWIFWSFVYIKTLLGTLKLAEKYVSYSF